MQCNKNIAFIALVALGSLQAACGCGSSAPAPITWTTTMKGKISGNVGIIPISGSPLTITEAGGTATSTPSATDTVIDGTKESGAATAGTPFTLTGKTKDGCTITMTGTLDANCVGRGNWSLQACGNSPAGSGTWTVP